jgi:tRNA-specific 2-thiouridylase
VDIEEFLAHYTTFAEGAVLDETGKRIGTHRGTLIYTLGQRHGFVIDAATANEDPYYVISKDSAANTITVAHEPPHVQKDEVITLEQLSWTGEPLGADASGVLAQFRYRQTPFSVSITSVTNEGVTITVPEGVERPARGQSCVFYTEEGVCLGGGVVR